MNSVNLVGYLANKPQVNYGSQNNTAYCSFSLVVGRGKSSNGEDLGADLIRCVVYGNQAENLAKYKDKNDLVSIEGSLTTSEYTTPEGKKVLTMSVRCNRITYLNRNNNNANNQGYNNQGYNGNTNNGSNQNYQSNNFGQSNQQVNQQPYQPYNQQPYQPYNQQPSQNQQSSNSEQPDLSSINMNDEYPW